jgi:ABC-type phosphate transport system permease subunit
LLNVRIGRNWIRIPAIVYGVHVVTTLIPILAAQFLDPAVRPTDNVTLAGLVAIYSIYLFIPLYIALTNIFKERPFGEDTKSLKKKQ